MATSGSLNTSGYEGRYLQLTWSRQSYDIASNPATSTIAWELRGAGSASSSWYYAGPFNVEINGQKVYQSSNRIQLYDGTLVASGTLTIAHSADGTCSFGAYVSAAIFSSSVNVDGSGSWTLDALPRASSISCGTLTMGVVGTITINSASAAFTHKLSYHFGAITEDIITTTGGGTVRWAPPLSLAEQIPTKMADAATLTCQTYSGGTLIGSDTKTITMYVPEYEVTGQNGWTTATYENSGTAAAGIGAFVKGYSRARITVDTSKITTQYGAYIAYARVVCGSVDTVDYPYMTGVLDSTSVTAYVYAVDSRGKTLAGTVNIAVNDYFKPTLSNLALYRGDSAGYPSENGTYIWARATMSYAAVGGLNNCTMRGSFRESTGDFGAGAVMQSGTAIALTTEAAAVKSYEAKIEIQDTLGSSAAYIAKIPTQKITFHLKEGGNGAAFGKYAEKDGLLDVAWGMKVGGELEIEPEAGIKLPVSNGDYLKIISTLSGRVIGIVPSTDSAQFACYADMLGNIFARGGVFSGGKQLQPMLASGSAGSDLNNMHTTGCYWCQSTLANMPVADYGFMLIFQVDTDVSCIQIVFTLGSGVYYRVCINNGTWYAWAKI